MTEKQITLEELHDEYKNRTVAEQIVIWKEDIDRLEKSIEEKEEQIKNDKLLIEYYQERLDSLKGMKPEERVLGRFHLLFMAPISINAL